MFLFSLNARIVLTGFITIGYTVLDASQEAIFFWEQV